MMDLKTSTSYYNTAYKKIIRDGHVPTEVDPLVRKMSSNILRASITDVLDIGGGLGRHSRFFAELGCNVTMLDTSSVAVSYVNELAKNNNLNIVAEVKNIFKYDPSKKYDIILACWILDELGRNNVAWFLDILERLLHENGVIALSNTDATNKQTKLSKKVDGAMLNQREWRVTVNRSGLRIENFELTTKKLDDSLLGGYNMILRHK